MQVTGELRQWHKITLDFEGPSANGDAADSGASSGGVRPWTAPSDHPSFDVSRLAQRDIVFAHAQEKGINLHLFLQETENDRLLNIGDPGPERTLNMRGMCARTGGPTRPARRVQGDAPAS